MRLGQHVHLHIVNDTREYHPIHPHGHTLSLLARDGRSIQGSPIHVDTVLVAPHQTWDVAFVADNPGIWMLHCHVLIHAAFGMSMTVNYANVSTRTGWAVARATSLRSGPIRQCSGMGPCALVGRRGPGDRQLRQSSHSRLHIPG